jgi:penicillin-binding protein 2
MLTAVSVLENNIVTPQTRIFDSFIFQRDGIVFSRCNMRHGYVNVVDAIAVSCNYFFFETSYSLGIRALNETMVEFGLGQPTGVEIFDINRQLQRTLPPGLIPIASPQFRMHQRSGRWFTGDTIHVSIGQGDNTLTAAEMARFTAIFATGGDRYQMHFKSHITAHDGTVLSRFTPVVEHTVPMLDTTVDAIRRGMLQATEGHRGTAIGIFRNFPIQVAGKTGTTQEAGWPNHSSFAAYAPFENPEIALYIVLPGSAQTTISQPAARMAVEILSVYFGLDTDVWADAGRPHTGLVMD